jgi:hypothetical protein
VNGVPDESVDIVEINFTAEARRVGVVVAAVMKPGDFPEEAALVFKTNLAAESQISFAFVAAAAGTVGIHIEERALHEESWPTALRLPGVFEKNRAFEGAERGNAQSLSRSLPFQAY